MSCLCFQHWRCQVQCNGTTQKRAKTNNGEIDWNAQRDGKFFSFVPSSKSISYYVGFVACYLWCTKKVDRKITRFEWLNGEWGAEGGRRNIINVFIHEKMSFVRIKNSKRFFYGFTDSRAKEFLRRNFHKNDNPQRIFKKLQVFSLLQVGISRCRAHNLTRNEAFIAVDK